MRNESVFIFLISLVITIAIVSAVYYFAVARQSVPEQTGRGSPVGGVPAKHIPVRSERSDKIIKCQDPELGEFYTNASTCDKADLKQRLSTAQSVNPKQPRPTKARFAGANAQQSSNAAQSRARPNLRSPAKSPPRGLSAECRFPVGEAAELERRMGGADDPRDSIWREDYCEWREKVTRLGCELPRDFYYYSFSDLCR